MSKTKGISRKQAEYHARRAAQAEYARKMADPHGPGKSWMRVDGAQLSANLAYEHKLAEHGFTVRE